MQRVRTPACPAWGGRTGSQLAKAGRVELGPAGGAQGGERDWWGSRHDRGTPGFRDAGGLRGDGDGCRRRAGGTRARAPDRRVGAAGSGAGKRRREAFGRGAGAVGGGESPPENHHAPETAAARRLGEPRTSGAGAACPSTRSTLPPGPGWRPRRGACRPGRSARKPSPPGSGTPAAFSTPATRSSPRRCPRSGRWWGRTGPSASRAWNAGPATPAASAAMPGR